MADYVQITDPTLQARVLTRYRHEMASLQALGFRPLAYCLESLAPYSAIVQFPIMLLAFFNREVLLIQRPLRLAVANALLQHSDPPAIALCMGMGIKIYTPISDRTVLVSSDFISRAPVHPGDSILRLPPSSTLEQTWLAHRKRAREMLSETSNIPLALSFQDYVEMSMREEDWAQSI